MDELSQSLQIIDTPHIISRYVIETLCNHIGYNPSKRSELVNEARRINPAIQPLYSLLSHVENGKNKDEVLNLLNADLYSINHSIDTIQDKYGTEIVISGSIKLAEVFCQRSSKLKISVIEPQHDNGIFEQWANFYKIKYGERFKVCKFRELHNNLKRADVFVSDVYGVDSVSAYCKTGAHHVCSVAFNQVPLTLIVTPIQLENISCISTEYPFDFVSLNFFSKFLIDGKLLEAKPYADTIYDVGFDY
jgi:hypothetical protein